MSLPVVDYRRSLHRIPELDTELPQTMDYVREHLSRLQCRLTSPIRSSICAFFDAGRSDAIAFRADMDALPIQEETGLPFASEHPGRMHACGHDAHTAMLLALADFLDTHLSQLPRNVLLIFQPAEETVGGARQICHTGALERFRVRRLYGMHLWPGLEPGVLFSRPGPMMARANEIDILIHGKSAHLTRASEAVDALDAGVTFLRRASSMMEQLPPDEPRVLRFGKMTSGDARNVISGHTLLQGSLRTYSEKTFRFCRQRLEEIGRTLGAETRCRVEVQISEGYPAVWNHERLYEDLCRKLGRSMPRTLKTPVLASEDFSFFQQYVPGIFFFLGAGSSGELHSSTFSFDDEAILPRGVEFWETLAMLE